MIQTGLGCRYTVPDAKTDRFYSSEGGMFIRGAYGERNQRTKIIISTEIAERNAAPTIVYDVNRSGMLSHADITW
jgi:hypothetical protein